MMRHTAVLLGFAAVALIAPGADAPAADPSAVVRKTAETFDDLAWRPDPYNRAEGAVTLAAETAPDAPAGRALVLDVRFSGKGFEWFAAGPSDPLVIPGRARSLVVRYRVADKRYPLTLRFQDGWGRTEVEKKKLEWSPRVEAEGAWAVATFKVPDDWVQPLTVAAVATHNWSAQAEERTVRFALDHLEVETDLADVDPATGAPRSWRPDPAPADPAKALKQPPAAPLVAASLATGEVSNVFAGAAPSVTVRVRNWTPPALEGRVACRLRDSRGREVDRREEAVRVESTAALRLPLQADRFGLYTLEADLVLAGPDGGAGAAGLRRTVTLTLARLPAPADLTPAEKRASPYGINVHGGRENFVIEPFRRAGLVWFRDYAFGYEWLLRAKGDDRRYAGWPHYPALVRRYAQAGVELLPCLMKGLRPPQVKDGKAAGPVGPDRAWVREIADIVNAFPAITHWELDNEYDLARENAEAEEAIRWANYRAYHRRFAEVLDILGGGELVAVEQGRAGIWPERIRACVASGDFAKVGVVNSHHYCGVEPPETNLGNWNTDAEGDYRAQPPRLFFDCLRDAKRAGEADGRPRESWLTEFGWDTLAGNIVTAEEQAAYLARAWMLALAAGTDKAFWFYDYDAPDPKQFFDGCGLLAADGSPKLALAALAGLAHVLPAPRAVGLCDAGPDTWGVVFENRGDLVAALWTVAGDAGPPVTFKAKRLYDFLGNPIEGLSVRLGPAPVYAVGLDRSDLRFRQAAYGLATPYAVLAAAGDPVTAVLSVRNRDAAGLACTVWMDLPEGWKAERLEASATVPPGGAADVPLRFTVPGGEPVGVREVAFAVEEGRPVKTLPLKVLVQAPTALQVGPLAGAPGPAGVAVRVRNRTARPMEGVLRLHLPSAWRTETPEVRVAALAPGETREVRCALSWSPDWKSGESARVEFDAGEGRTASRPIIPPALRLRRARGVKVDGALDDWPAEARMPAWLLGSTLGEAQADVYLAWAEEGLYGAVQVRDSAVRVPDPRTFWAGDCLELFLDTADDKRDRAFQPGDHQFWFVPLPAEKRAYVGQWKRGGETAATRYDLAGPRTAAVAAGDGYVMEFLLPAAEIQKYAPAVGRRLGLNLNLTVRGRRLSREVYWPVAKSWSVQDRPGMWGSVELVE